MCRMVRPSVNLTPPPHVPRPRLQYFSFLPTFAVFFLSCLRTSGFPPSTGFSHVPFSCLVFQRVLVLNTFFYSEEFTETCFIRDVQWMFPLAKQLEPAGLI